MCETEKHSGNKRISWECLSTYRGVLMGISIIAIIFFHFGEDCRTFDIHYNSLNVLYQTYIGSAGVDGFLFLSGLGLYFSMKKNASVAGFYKRRFTKILIPYFILAIPAWAYSDLIYTKAGVAQYFSDLFFVSFFTDGNCWFWYIGMICVCYLIFPYIFRLVETASDAETGQMRALTIITFITVVAIAMNLYCSEFFSNVNIAWLRFTPFIVGSFVGKAVYEKKPISFGTFGIIILSFLLLPLVKNDYAIITRYIRGLFYICIMILIAVFCSWIIPRLKRHPVRKILNWFGDYSLELYLSHVMVRNIMIRLGYKTCHIRYECIMLIIALIISLLLKKLTHLIVHIKKN